MACLTIQIEPTPSATLAVSPYGSANVASEATQQAALVVEPTPQLALSIGEVCGVSPGTMVVLAASDGPLRTRDGGFLLLDPATNPPEG